MTGVGEGQNQLSHSNVRTLDFNLFRMGGGRGRRVLSILSGKQNCGGGRAASIDRPEALGRDQEVA